MTDKRTRVLIAIGKSFEEGTNFSKLADAAIAAMEQPDEPEVPAVLMEMARAICLYQNEGVNRWAGFTDDHRAEHVNEARAALRVVVRTTMRGGASSGPIAMMLGMTDLEIDGLMNDGSAEGGEG